MKTEGAPVQPRDFVPYFTIFRPGEGVHPAGGFPAGRGHLGGHHGNVARLFNSYILGPIAGLLGGSLREDFWLGHVLAAPCTPCSG